MRLILLALLGVLASCGLRAQTEEGPNRFLSGIVVDASTEEPVPFAYVIIGRGRSRGVLTNETGQFRLAYTEAQLTDTVFLSRVGFHQTSFVLEELVEEQAADGPLVLRMATQLVDIPVVTVRASWEPKLIIRRALESIPTNYGVPRFQTGAYYRQYGLRNGEYTDMREAFVTIYDDVYDDPAAHSIIYMDYLDEKIYDEEQVSDFLFPKENPIYALYEEQNNSARYHHVHWMSVGDKDFFDIFDFNIQKIFTNARDTVASIGYRINPEAAGLSERALQTLAGWTRGEVWINLRDYAIIRNVRGDENGNVFSEVYYSKIGKRYFPARITSVFAIDYGYGDYYVCNRTLAFFNVTNTPKLIRETFYKQERVPRRKALGELRIAASEPLDAQRRMLLLTAPEASSIEAARREYQREQLGAAAAAQSPR